MLKKSEELPSMRQTGRKRNRELRPSVSPTSSENVYAPTARTSQSIEHAMASGRKRRRQSNTEKTTNEDKSFRLPIHSPHAHGTVSQSTKLQRYLEGTTTTSDPNVSQPSQLSAAVLTDLQQHEYNIDSAVDTLIDAAGSDTESETAEAPKVFRDHNGLNSIVKAIDLVESSSSPSCPSLTATPESINTTAVEAIQDDNKLPQLTPPWTPINEGHSISHHEVKAPLHTGLITPVSALFNCPQPASRSPLNVPSNHRSARLFDGGEAGRNEESRYTDRNHSHGYVQNAVHGARPPTNERNSLAKTSKHDA